MQYLSLLVLALTAAASMALAAPIDKRQNTYVGYLITHFIGTDEKIYQQISNGNDPYSYTALNGGAPVLTPASGQGTGGVRDPYLVTSPSRDNFWVIGTDLQAGVDGFNTVTGSRSIYIWNSNDLVNWSASSLVQVEDATAGMVWAPSAIYDEASSQYFVFWSSKFYAESDTAHSGEAVQQDTIRYATTRDFVTFSAPQEYLRGENNTPLIDQEFQPLGNNAFVRYVKDENALKVFSETSTNGLFGTWTRTAGQNGWTVDVSPREGPAAFRDNSDASIQHLLLDDYSGNGRYVPYQTTDVNAGSYDASNTNTFPSNVRHGSVTPVTQAEYDALRARI